MSFKVLIESKFEHKIDLKKINVRSKSLQADLISKRIVITRYISDYISEHMGLGRTVQASDRGFKNQSAAPDAAIDINKFKQLTGIDAKASPQNPDLGFFETKVKGLGNTTGIDLTSATAAYGSLAYKRISQAAIKRGTKEVGGQDAVDLLFSKAFDAVRKSLLTSTEEKIENLLIVNTIDADKKPTLQLLFVKNPITKVSLSSAANVAKNYSIRIRPGNTDTDGNILSYRIDISPKSTLFNNMLSRAKDITNRVMSMHDKGISDNLMLYLVDRIKKANYSGDEVNDYLSIALAIVNEFKVGGHTPFVINTEISLPQPGATSANLVLTGALKKQAMQKQKFLSSMQWTALVQQKLGQTMRKSGKAHPYNFTERTGRWRESIQVSANYRTKLIEFTYNPIYRVNMAYGYRPDTQIKTAIRQVASKLYSYEFGLVAKK